jgi:hypothetical protein
MYVNGDGQIKMDVDGDRRESSLQDVDGDQSRMDIQKGAGWIYKRSRMDIQKGAGWIYKRSRMNVNGDVGNPPLPSRATFSKPCHAIPCQTEGGCDGKTECLRNTDDGDTLPYLSYPKPDLNATIMIDEDLVEIVKSDNSQVVRHWFTFIRPQQCSGALLGAE